MTPAERIHNFAAEILRRGASELKTPEELVGACVLIVASSFREGVTETEVDAALSRFTQAIKQAIGADHSGNTGMVAN